MILILALLQSIPALADTGQMFGYGNRASALTGHSTAAGFDAWSAYANPAGLARPGGKDVAFSYSTLWMKPAFKSISNVTVENQYVSDQTRAGSAPTSYRTAFGHTFGLALRLAPSWNNLSAGLMLYSPLENTSVLDTGETYLPEYVLHRARAHRPQFHAGLGATIAEQLFVGLAMRVGYATTSRSTFFLKTTTGEPTTMRFESTIKPRAGFTVGVQYAGDVFQSGLVLRLPLRYPTTFSIDSTAEALGGLGGLDFNLAASTPLYYDPLSLELGASWGKADQLLVEAQVAWERWSDFEMPTIEIQNSTTRQGVLISGSRLPNYTLQDLIVPRIGAELPIGGLRVRAGYSYRASIFKELPTGAGNALDPPQHRLGLGVGIPLRLSAPAELHVFLQGQFLASQDIVKTAGDEAGNLSDSKIGAPGYTAGGAVFGGGVGVTVEL
jgi:hypothetical protein